MVPMLHLLTFHCITGFITSFVFIPRLDVCKVEFVLKL